MVLAKPAGTNPRALAEALSVELAKVAAVVAVIPHEENMTGRNFHRRHVIGIALTRVNGVILHPVRQRFANDRQMATQHTIITACQCARKVIVIARVVGIDRQDQVRLGFLLHRLSI